MIKCSLGWKELEIILPDYALKAGLPSVFDQIDWPNWLVWSVGLVRLTDMSLSSQMLESSQRLLEILHMYACDFQFYFSNSQTEWPLLLLVTTACCLFVVHPKESLVLSSPQPLQMKAFNLISRIFLPRPRLPWACTESPSSLLQFVLGNPKARTVFLMWPCKCK